jgi:hypothetical protein
MRETMRPNTRCLLTLATLAACSCGSETANQADASSVAREAAGDAGADVLYRDTGSDSPQGNGCSALPSCDSDSGGSGPCPCTWGEAVKSAPRPSSDFLSVCSGGVNAFTGSGLSSIGTAWCLYSADGGEWVFFSFIGNDGNPHYCEGPSDFPQPRDCVPWAPDAGGD